MAANRLVIPDEHDPSWYRLRRAAILIRQKRFREAHPVERRGPAPWEKEELESEADGA